MPWRYKKMENEYGHNQMFDCSQSPKRAVCSSCHLSYTNTGKGTMCSDCTGVYDDGGDGTGQSTEEVINEHGFVDHLLLENGLPVYYTASKNRIIVCPQCKGMTMPNRGQGTLCITCRSDFDRECEHDMSEP